MLKTLKIIWDIDIKKQMIFLLLVFAVFGVLKQGIKATFPQLIIAIFTALFLDYLITYLVSKKVFFSTSAVISGFIIALVLKPAMEWYIPTVAAAVAIYLPFTMPSKVCLS